VTVDPLSFDASTTKAPSPPMSWKRSHVLEEDDTPASIKFGAFFGTQIFLGPMGLVFSRTQKFLPNMFNLT